MTSDTGNIKYARWPEVTDEHLQALLEVGISGHWHYGPKGSELEAALAREFVRPAVAVASCSSALFLSLRALSANGIVVVPAYGYYGTSHPIVWAGCRPLFVDCDPYTFNMCPDALGRALREKRVDAVIGVHIHGLPFDWDIVDICGAHGVPLIEDVCQAQGARLRETKVGTLGEYGAFSFNNRKTLPAGLGGAVLAKNADAARRVVELRDYGQKAVNGDLASCGYYFPISEFDATLILVQLKHLNQWLKRGDIHASTLRAACPKRFPQVPPDRTHTWHKIRIRGTEDERLALERAGVKTSRWGPKPLPDLPCYQGIGETLGSYPGAKEICERSFCLLDDEHSIHIQTDATVDAIARAIRRILCR